eukprot:g7491.t1
MLLGVGTLANNVYGGGSVAEAVVAVALAKVLSPLFSPGVMTSSSVHTAVVATATASALRSVSYRYLQMRQHRVAAAAGGGGTGTTAKMSSASLQNLWRYRFRTTTPPRPLLLLLLLLLLRSSPPPDMPPGEEMRPMRSRRWRQRMEASTPAVEIPSELRKGSDSRGCLARLPLAPPPTSSRPQVPDCGFGCGGHGGGGGHVETAAGGGGDKGGGAVGAGVEESCG